MMPGGGPAITKVSPGNNEAGVHADAKIVVTFDTPMAQTSVEAAWTSAELPASAVTFAWDGAGTTLTVTPKMPLALAEGAGLDPSVVQPKSFAFAIAATATDVDGRPLEQVLSSQFTTERHLTTRLAVNSPLTRSLRSDGVVFGEAAVTMVAGDTTADLQEKMYATFGLPALPAGARLDVATLSGNQTSTTLAPYSFGGLRVLHASVPVIDAASFVAAALGTVGDLSKSASIGTKSIEVTAELADDLAHAAARNNNTQYRIEFPTATDNDAGADEARFSRSSFELAVAYFVP
jgi:Big-like domain-containing protein